MPGEILEACSNLQVAKAWLIHAKKFDEKHDLACVKYDRYNFCCGSAAAILQPVIALAIVANWIKEDSGLLKTLAVLATLVTTGLVGFVTFGDFARQAEKHRLARSRFKTIIHEIELLIPTLKQSSDHADLSSKAKLEEIRQGLAKVRDEAPTLPQAIHKKVERQWKIVHSRTDLTEPDTHCPRRGELRQTAVEHKE